MDLHADHAFNIGQQHVRDGTPCQDYAVSGVHGRLGYAIVSDGCSGGRWTDVGARIMALRARSALIGDAISSLASIGEALCLTQMDLLATRLQATVVEGTASVKIEGDGAFAIRRASGSLTAVKIAWAGNMPCYPAYAEDGYIAFIEAQGGDPSASSMYIEGWRCEPGGPMTLSESGGSSIEAAMHGYRREFLVDDEDPITHVAVFTDGVEQVDGIAWPDVIQNLMAFKTGAGEFARRRMQRFLADAAKVGRGPQDDIAFAVIALPT